METCVQRPTPMTQVPLFFFCGFRLAQLMKIRNCEIRPLRIRSRSGPGGTKVYETRPWLPQDCGGAVTVTVATRPCSFLSESFGLLNARNINKGLAKICGIATAAADLQELVVRLKLSSKIIKSHLTWVSTVTAKDKGRSAHELIGICIEFESTNNPDSTVGLVQIVLL